jgi:hypothetical protein
MSSGSQTLPGTTVKRRPLSAVGFIATPVAPARAVVGALGQIGRIAVNGGVRVCTRPAAMLAAVTVACLLGTSAAGALQSKCIVRKNKCMAKTVASMLKCYEKAETPGKNPDPNANACLGKADEKFTGGSDPAGGCFAKLESKPSNDCVTYDDALGAEGAIFNCVNQLVFAIDPNQSQSLCGVGKDKCVGKKLARILKCQQKAETPGKPTEPNAKGCVDKAVSKYDGGLDPSKGCFVTLENESGSDCQVQGLPLNNQAQLEAIVDGSCVGAFVAVLAPPCGTFISAWGTLGSGTGQFDHPAGVAVEASGNVFVADTSNNRIKKFDNAGGFLTAWGSSGTGNGQFDRPVRVAVDTNGNVFVSDSANNRIQKFDNAGGFLAAWGSFGTGNGQFDGPDGVAVDTKRHVFVADTNNNRIQKFACP